MFLYVIFIIIGFILLSKGADFLVNGAIQIAKKFNIPTIIIGLTIVAVGTSMPELIVSITASLSGHSDISIGNVIGSNLANLLLILGICALIKPLKFKEQTEKIENFIVLFSIILLFIFGNNKGNVISRTEGLIFIICTIIFIIYNILLAKKHPIEETEVKIKLSTIKTIIYILIGIIALKFGGDLVVEYASNIAAYLGLSEKLISVTVISFSTSLPELITCITATKKDESDIAIGNLLGSQILNIFLIIGISALVQPIEYSPEYNIHIYFLILGTIFLTLYPFEGKKHYISTGNGASLLALYIIYISYCIIK